MCRTRHRGFENQTLRPGVTLLSLLKNARNVMTHIKPIGQANVSSVVCVDISRMLASLHEASVQRRVQYGCS